MIEDRVIRVLNMNRTEFSKWRTSKIKQLKKDWRQFSMDFYIAACELSGFEVKEEYKLKSITKTKKI